jgi:hypothetical protein
LRFFAGPIVERINPVGLLFGSAVFGTLGLFLLGQPSVNSTWPWILAVTIYGIGKTFYWPTLLGVISERFPKGGALALGISGGIGMISAGLLGGPGIGYKQDYFAVQKLKETSPEAYDRYMARTESGEPETSGFPVVTQVLPGTAPPIAGLDNSKLKVFDDWGGVLASEKAGKPAQTTLQSELELLNRLKAEGKPVEPKLEKNLNALNKWWEENGKPNYAADKDKIEEARLYGAKTALLYTAAVPAMLAIGFLILIGYFVSTGGYKQIHLHGDHPPMEEY